MTCYMKIQYIPKTSTIHIKSNFFFEGEKIASADINDSISEKLMNDNTKFAKFHGIIHYLTEK